MIGLWDHHIDWIRETGGRIREDGGGGGGQSGVCVSCLLDFRTKEDLVSYFRVSPHTHTHTHTHPVPHSPLTRDSLERSWCDSIIWERSRRLGGGWDDKSLGIDSGGRLGGNTGEMAAAGEHLHHRNVRSRLPLGSIRPGRRQTPPLRDGHPRPAAHPRPRHRARLPRRGPRRLHRPGAYRPPHGPHSYPGRYGWSFPSAAPRHWSTASSQGPLFN